ncbi:transposase [Kineosporia sp. NBRC 101677]|uniref:transposase n=1 Tax=Kineosporia sp. NBRC 101677 TaxID=3032197 RepID=UPI0024A40798|nr:transposase [Kineosporia sp. NBRC 101677]GLY19712.1 transposase [Kineosporia sp. NBRC 101677]
MGSTRRSYTAEYKAQSTSYVIDEGRSIAEVARNIGVHEITLGKWVRMERQERESQPAAAEALDDDERLELIRLRQQAKDDKAKISELQMQVEFAKKVATWFAKDQQ